MFFNRNVFAVACCVLFYFSSAGSENEDGKSNEDEESKNNETIEDDHSFVALIDIVFMDGSKRTCTGTIIHNNVVITAAHCFCHPHSEEIKPELAASFVVIGNKKMFDTGYEQYLPIERIITHPQFRGWTADLALIYTFAAMTADKPGRVMPLAGEKMSNPVDSNVTIYSWGHSKDNEETDDWYVTTTTKEPCDDSTEDATGFQGTDVYRVTAGLDSKRSRGQQKLQLHMSRVQPETDLPKNLRLASRFQTESRTQMDRIHKSPSHKVLDNIETELSGEESATTKPLSRYLTSNEDNVDNSQPQQANIRAKRRTSTQATNMHADDEIPEGRYVTRRSSERKKHVRVYKNWRRHMGKLQNKLRVEVFGFVNMAACKKIVEGSNSNYDIKNGEVTCYTSDDHYIHEEDSGAPAVRHGHLVAVTVGGARGDGDHVGIGMKMSCYCTWIADNLPGGGANISCCKNCCDSKNSEDLSRNMFRNRNTFLYKY